MDYKLRSDVPIPKLNGFSVGDFWSWAYSDVLSNRNRGIFAEFLIGAALDVLDKPRIEWDEYDLLYQEKKIEVKTSAYLQSWPQSKPSNISFDIAGRNGQNEIASETNNVQIHRAAHCYVFCLFSETNRDKANVFDIDTWEFYVVSTDQLDKVFGAQKRLTLKRLNELANPVKFEPIKQTIDGLLFVKTT